MYLVDNDTIDNLEKILELLENIKIQLDTQAQEIERDYRLDDLWTIDEIALYTKSSVGSVRKLIALPQFPVAIKLPTSENGGHPRWLSKEVKAFCKQFKIQ